MNGDDGQTTGDARVDAALARFDELAEAPLTAHPEIFEDVHRRLQDALTGIEEGPPDGPVTEGNRIASTGAQGPDLPHGAHRTVDTRQGAGQDPPLQDARRPSSTGDDPLDAEGDAGG